MSHQNLPLGKCWKLFRATLKWDHFEILAKDRSDTHCKIKKTLIIQGLEPTLNDTVSSEKLYPY